MSFKNKLRIKQQRRSDRRRKERKRLKKLRIKKADERRKLKISNVLEKHELPEEIAVEEVVKNGAKKGIISVKFDKQIYSINVKDVSLKKMVYSVNTGEEKCATLEGFSKIILLNRERTTSILASAI